jgi:predicted transcriptional regulator
VRSVLISIQPKWCELIASGKKTVEVRKTRPKLDTPFKVYIYQTKESKRRYNDHRFNSIFSEKTSYDSMGKVIGEFVCDYMTELKADNMAQAYYNNTKDTCLTDEEIKRYANGKKLYYWHISNLVIYDKPRELSEFRSYNVRTYRENGYPMPTHEIKRPPQSWGYVESEGKERPQQY